METLLIAIAAFFLLEILYFKLADQYNIIDKPNLRSSHNQITLRGGGLIFPVAAIIGVVIYAPNQWYIATGVFAIALISFLDDIISLNNKIRISVHFIAVSLVIYQVNENLAEYYSSLFFCPYFLIFIPITFILIIGIINAYNFMDGINGITVLYSLVTIGSIYFVQQNQEIPILDHRIYIFIIASLIVFGFFNFRRKAKAFSGDVGSISIALIICYLILQIILITGEVKWIFLLGIYGLDSVATIVCRIFRGENIFDAHRSHFYQYLANERKWSHLTISFMYSLIQFMLNVFIIYTNGYIFTVILFLLIVFLYILLRLKWEGKSKLLFDYDQRSFKNS